MKKIFSVSKVLLTSLLVVFTLLVSCSKDGDYVTPEIDYKTVIVGKWTILKSSTYFVPNNGAAPIFLLGSSPHTPVEMKADGTYNLDGSTGTYEIDGDKYIEHQGYDGTTTIYTIKVKNNNEISLEKKGDEEVEYLGQKGNGLTIIDLKRK